ncbi:MAG: UDP-glucose 6-dehydrogenase 1 [Bathelium mastoideum]|nr:MAG: UDP-glucose 6-dehydrogenase 1 [Bathelium mastoideum]
MVAPPGLVKKICCIGAGYVGGPTCAMIADKNPNTEVTVVDLNEARIRAWNTDDLPVYEPDLLSYVKSARDGAEGKRRPNLFFSTDVDAAVKAADLIFISVNTPTKYTGTGAGSACDLGYVESATRKIAEVAESDKIIIEKSTVPCKTAETIREILAATGRPGVRFEILSNPEFLAEGTAMNDLLHPDRILIGSLRTERGFQAAEVLSSVYGAWVPRDRIMTINLWSSELTKIAANALLAQRISSVNALSAICEATGADIDEVAYACGKDTRIGPRMLKASVGFGGSCFKKDILSLAYISDSLHLPEVAAYWRSVVDINEYQKDRFTRRITKTLYQTLTNKRIAVLGFAYKKNTGDTRETAAISVVNSLVLEQANIRIYDPRVKEEQIWQDLMATASDVELLKKRVTVCSSAYEACTESHAAVILTEWDEFSNKDYSTPTPSTNGVADTEGLRLNGKSPLLERAPTTDAVPQVTATNAIDGANQSASNATESHSSNGASNNGKSESGKASKRMDWRHVASLMKKPMFVFDGRNVVDVDKLESLGFRVECIGKSGTPKASNALLE